MKHFENNSVKMYIDEDGEKFKISDYRCSMCMKVFEKSQQFFSNLPIYTYADKASLCKSCFKEQQIIIATSLEEDKIKLENGRKRQKMLDENGDKPSERNIKHDWNTFNIGKISSFKEYGIRSSIKK